MTNHAPLPWTIEEYDENGGYDCMYPGICIKSGDEHVALIDGRYYDISAWQDPSEEVKQRMIRHAEMIVEAVNAHFGGVRND